MRTVTKLLTRPGLRGGLLLLFGALPLVGQTTFTLESALRRAHEANLDLLLSREQMVSSEQAQRRARANLLPQVSADATQRRNQSFFDLDAFGDTFPGGRVFSTSNSFEAALRARLSLFDVNNHADYRVAKFNTEIARLQLDQTAEDVREAIARLYFSHLRNLRQADAIKAQIERDEVLFELATKRAEAGTATQLDVTRAQVRLFSSELRLTQQETAIFETALEFKRGLDLDLGGTLELVPVDIDSTGDYAFSTADLEALLARRPEVVAERRVLARNQLAKRAADYEWLPSIDLSGSYGAAGRTFDDDLGEIWTIQLGVSMPLFEGFRIDANQMEAASAVRGQEIALRRIENNVEAEYRLALAQVETNARSIQIASKQVELAERELDLSRRRFTEGVADNSEVVDAQASLAEAEDGLVAAEYQYNLARLALARAKGDVRSLAL